MAGKILITAGGTGGHLFPAHALAAELGRRDWIVQLATDARFDRYGSNFPAEKITIISSATVGGASPVAIARAGALIARGVIQSVRLIMRLQPEVVVGFGGYPTLPPLFAAQTRKIPVIVHEQNAVLGRANRLMVKRAAAVATSFPRVRHLAVDRAKIVRTGNPVRDSVVKAAGKAYSLPDRVGRFRLLVFGGSQGARFFSDLMPAALALLSERELGRLQVTQQCRPEDLARVRDAYDRLGLDADLGSFFVDIAERLAAAQLVVSRSGASTVAELAVVGRPAILVPFPHAIDQDQAANAAVLGSEGAAIVAEQAQLGPQQMAEHLRQLMSDPLRLAPMAAAARRVGRPDAVFRLADLVERVARGEPPQPAGSMPKNEDAA